MVLYKSVLCISVQILDINVNIKILELLWRKKITSEQVRALLTWELGVKG